MTASHRSLQYNETDTRHIYFTVAEDWDSELVIPSFVNKPTLLKSVAQALGAAKNLLNGKPGDDIYIARVMMTDTRQYQVLAVNLRELFINLNNPNSALHVLEVSPTHATNIQESTRATSELLIEKLHKIKDEIDERAAELLLAQATKTFAINFETVTNTLAQLQELKKEASVQKHIAEKLKANPNLEHEAIAISLRVKKQLADLYENYNRDREFVLQKYKEHLLNTTGDRKLIISLQQLLIQIRNEAVKVINSLKPDKAEKAIADFNKIFNPTGYQLAPLKLIDTQWKIRSGNRDITTGVTDVTELTQLINLVLNNSFFKKNAEKLVAHSDLNTFITPEKEFKLDHAVKKVKTNSQDTLPLRTAEMKDLDLPGISDKLTALKKEIELTQTVQTTQNQIAYFQKMQSALEKPAQKELPDFAMTPEEEKLIQGFDQRIYDTQIKRREIIADVILFFQQTLVQLNEQRQASSNTSQAALETNLDQVTLLASQAEKLLQERSKILATITDSHELIEGQQNILIDITAALKNDVLKSGTGVKEMQTYLKQNASASTLEKLGEIKRIALARLSKDRSESTGNRTFPSLKNRKELVGIFYNIVANMELTTPAKVNATINKLTRAFPSIPEIASPTATPLSSSPSSLFEPTSPSSTSSKFRK